MVSFEGFSSQLVNILEAYQVDQDDALLTGFLSFVHSKLEKCIQESINERLYPHEAPTMGINKARDNFTRDDKNGEEDADLSILLDYLWRNVHYPIFKFFQSWRGILVPVNAKTNPRFVEFRKMNAKLTKVFKCIHKFYYLLLESMFKNYDTSEVVPSEVAKLLNIKLEHQSNVPVLNAENPLTITVVVLIHRSLVYLGTCHRYKQICENSSNNFEIQVFKKSQRYYRFASLVLPSVGESSLQEGLIYIQTKNFGYSTYKFMRSILSRLPSRAGMPNFISTVCEKRSTTFQQIAKLLQDLKRFETDKKRIINSEIIEMYFLVLFGAHVAPKVWKSEDETLAFNGVSLLHYKNVLYDRISTRYVKNISLIMQNLILLIGGFDVLLMLDSNENKKRTLQDLNPADVQYLTFACEYMSLLINNVIMNEWDKCDSSEYLAMVRIIVCWLKSNRIALHFAHRAHNLCSAISRLINAILKSDIIQNGGWSDHRPKRNYFFDEDVLLKEFKSVKFVLTDFRDDEIYKMEDSSERLAGMLKTRLSLKEENLLRIQAIVVSGKKFLMKNACDIKWANDQFIKVPKKTDERFKKMDNHSDGGKTSYSAVAKKSISVRDLEAKLQEQNKSDGRGYSGSSVPVAPASFNVKPSSSFTDSRSDVSGTSAGTTYAPSPYMQASPAALPHTRIEHANYMQYWAQGYQPGMVYNGMMVPFSQVPTIQQPPPGLGAPQYSYPNQNGVAQIPLGGYVYSPKMN